MILGRGSKDMYFLQKADESQNSHKANVYCHNSYVSCLTNSNIWHLILGHLPLYKLKTLSFVNLDKGDLNVSCEICAKARQHKLPFSKSNITTSRPFQLVRVDVWGPFHVSTYNGFKYFVTIVDDFSRTTWIHLIASKGSAFGIIKHFVAMAETQYDNKVQV